MAKEKIRTKVFPEYVRTESDVEKLYRWSIRITKGSYLISEISDYFGTKKEAEKDLEKRLSMGEKKYYAEKELREKEEKEKELEKKIVDMEIDNGEVIGIDELSKLLSEGRDLGVLGIRLKFKKGIKK